MPKDRTIFLGLRRFLGAILILTLVILALGIHPADAARKKARAQRAQPDRFAAIVIEASSGYVLSEKNADKRLYPASLTKMMTLYLAFAALERGDLSKNQRLFVSKRASRQEPSSLGLQTGDAIRAEDAILAIATKSANDCAVVLAEAVGDSEENFARMMTAKARQLGMNNSHFVNASGLFNRAQVSSARDMSILAQALIRDYPRYYHYFSTDTFTYDGNTYINHNKLMSTYRGMDGLKTGYVFASGYNLASSAVRNGTRLIGVVFGGKTPRSRNNLMAQLLDQGFDNVSNIRTASLSGKKYNRSLPTGEQISTDENGEPADFNAIASASGQTPQFRTMGLVIDQGDTDLKEENAVAKKFITEFRPRPRNTASIKTANAFRDGGWAIQVGAFSSHAAGTKALSFAKESLQGIVTGMDSIAPLMTNRGMVYRARLSGLGREDAAQACQILKGNCLILTVE